MQGKGKKSDADDEEEANSEAESEAEKPQKKKATKVESESEEESAEDQDPIKEYISELSEGVALYCLSELVRVNAKAGDEAYEHVIKKKAKLPPWKDRKKVFAALQDEDKISKGFSATAKGQCLLDLVAHVGDGGLLPAGCSLNKSYVQKSKKWKRADLDDHESNELRVGMWQLLLNHLHALGKESSKNKDKYAQHFSEALTLDWSKSEAKKFPRDSVISFLKELSKTDGGDDVDVKTPSQLKKAADKKKKGKKKVDSETDEAETPKKKGKNKQDNSDADEEEKKPARAASGLGNNALGFLKPKPKASRLMMGGNGMGAFGAGAAAMPNKNRRLAALGGFDDEFEF